MSRLFGDILNTSPDLKLDGYIELTNRSAPEVSATGHGKIYFDTTLNKFLVSENGVNFTSIGPLGTAIVGSTTIGEDATDWVFCDGYATTTIYTLPSPTIAVGEIVSMAALIEIDGYSSIGFAHFERRISVKYLSGLTIQTTTGGSADTDVTIPSIPNNISATLSGTSAAIVIDGYALKIKVTMPLGITANAKANVSWTRAPGNATPPIILPSGILWDWNADNAPNNGSIVTGSWIDDTAGASMAPTGSPLWITSAINGHAGIRLNGSSQYFLNATIGKAQPYEVWMVVKQISWVDFAYLFGGGGPAVIDQDSTTPGISLYAGLGPVGNNHDLALGTYGIVRTRFAGSSSIIQINNGTVSTISPGTTALAGGAAIGAFTDGSGKCNIEIARLLIVDTTAVGYSTSAIYTYLSGMY